MVYTAQMNSADCKSDWVNLVKRDKHDLGIKLNDSEIKTMSKGRFKALIEDRIFKYASHQLNMQKDSHSKSKLLPLFNGKPDRYLLSRTLTKEEKVTLFKLKTCMLDLSGNFPGGKNVNQKWCKLCHIFFEVQEHLLVCPIIRQKLHNEVDFSTIHYSDIEGPLNLQEKFAQTYQLIMTTREELLSNPPMGSIALDGG